MNTSYNYPIKVIYVIGQLTVGGTETQLLELVRHLDLHKFQVTVVSLSGQAHLADEFRDAGCAVYLLMRETGGRFSVLHDLYKLFRQVKPDIVHAFAYASRAAIPVSMFFPACKRIISIRTQPAWQIALADRVVISLVDYALTNSQKAWASLQPGFLKRVPGRVIYNGIDLAKFDAHLQDPLDGWDEPDSRIICIVARLQPVKGLDVLLRAFAQVSSTLASVRFWVIGDGPELQNLKDLADDLKIAEKVKFWGRQSNIPAFLRHAEIGVLSSHIEGLPNAIIEYMAAALPVVSTNVGGISELVVSGETGLLVSANDSQALAEAIVHLLSDPQRARQMGNAGRKRVETHFVAGRMVKETEDLYLHLLSEPARRKNER